MNNLFGTMLLLTSLSLGLAPVTQAANNPRNSGTDKPEHTATADYMPSLITATPLEGRMLAITMVRKTIGTIQRDGAIKRAVREEYQDDPELLMYAAELVALEFKTIARANNYWR